MITNFIAFSRSPNIVHLYLNVFIIPFNIVRVNFYKHTSYKMAKRFTRSSKMINIVKNSNNTIIYDDNNIIETNVSTKKRKTNDIILNIQSAKRAGMLIYFS